MPFGATFFHLGIHNIPRRDARRIMEVLTSFTLHPREEKLREILAMLRYYHYRHILLVLNHPLMDEKGVGTAQHAQILGQLLSCHGASLDALEVTGLPCWKENERIIRLGQQTAFPVISGGRPTRPRTERDPESE
jgi:hypothetical protein